MTRLEQRTKSSSHTAFWRLEKTVAEGVHALRLEQTRGYISLETPAVTIRNALASSVPGGSEEP